MLTVLQLLSSVHPTLLTHVGSHIEIPNSPFMTLTVENIGRGPRNLPAVSLCHYGSQNGDAMRDPEMCFELAVEDGKLKDFLPYYYRNDYVGTEQFARNEQIEVIDPRTVATQKEFAELWGRNLRAQGFLRGYSQTTL